MKKRIVLPVLVLSLFLFFFSSCGIPNIFTFEDAILDISNNGDRLRFSNDSGVFTGHLMFLYLLTDNVENISDIQKGLISSIKAQYVKNKYNSIHITYKGESAVSTYTDQSKTYGLYQLHIKKADENLNNNGQNWASNYMFTISEGDYSIDYELDENRNLVISIFDYSNQDTTDSVLARAITFRCNDLPFEFNETKKDDYTADNPSNMTLYILPVIVINSPEYNNILLYCSSSFATV